MHLRRALQAQLPGLWRCSRGAACRLTPPHPQPARWLPELHALQEREVVDLPGQAHWRPAAP